MRKKGEAKDLVPVATFLLFFALFLLVYVMLLPADEKEKLFNITTKENASSSSSFSGKVLFSKNIGEVNSFEEEEKKHDIDSVKLFTKEESKIESLASSLYISRTFLGNRKQDVNFKLSEGAERLKLLFNVLNSEGNLIISLNDNIVFNGKLNIADLPLELPISYLKEDNTLTFEASSVGWRVLSRNFYELKDIKLIKNFVTENVKERRTLSITESEKNTIEKSSLSFFANCLSNENGFLKIMMNRRLIYSTFVVCDAKQKEIGIKPELISSGVNELQFEIDNGDYIFENIELVNELKQKPLSYNFFVESKDYSKIKEDNKDAILKIDFTDKDRKRAYVYINGNSFELDTTDEEYEKNVDSYIRNGENTFKIVPKNSFEIINLRIVLE